MAGRIVPFIALSLVYGACTSSCGYGHAAPHTAPASTPHAVETPRDAPTRLVLEASADDSATSTFVRVLLGDRSVATSTIGASHTYPSLARSDAPAWHRTVSAAFGDRFARVARMDATYTLFVHATEDGRELAQLDLGAMEPHAISLTETGVFIGASTLVAYVDLETRPLSLTTLVTRTDPYSRKAYDVFARSGDRVVAIDDMVRPIYADLFALAPHGAPRRLADWSMPSLINGSYRHATLIPRGDERFTLFVVAPYGVLSGNGQEVAALPIEGTRLIAPGDVLNTGGAVNGVTEEHEPRGGPEPKHLLAGDTLTLFTGIAVTHGSVLLAAGTRGLFILPESLGRAATATVITDAGEVHDVLVMGERIFALTSEAEENVLVEIAIMNNAFTIASRLPLPGRYVRFVN